MDVRSLEQRKFNEYAKYKQFQRKFDYLLKLAEDPSELRTMSIEQLLNAFAKVEQMYLMRTQYRNKYYTPENWDPGHQQFIGYLLGIMNIYVNQLKQKFQQMRIQPSTPSPSPLQQGKDEVLDSMSDLERDVVEINDTMRQREDEEREIWNTIIPDLIAQKQAELQKRKSVMLLLRRFFSKYYYLSDVQEAPTIDIVVYFLQVRDLITRSGIYNSKTKQINPNKKPAPWFVPPYPLTFDEFIIHRPEFKTFDSAKSILISFYNLDKFSAMLTGLIHTLLNITKLSRTYVIIQVPYKNYSAFIPNLIEFDNIILLSKGKMVLAFNFETSELEIVRIDQQINFHIYR